MRPIILACIWLLIGMGGALAQTMSEPEALARAEKFADQVVRVIPQRTGGMADQTVAGFGLIVGERFGRVFVATPYHVAFGSERPSSLSETPGVVFRGDRYTVIQARRLPVASPTDDLAVIEVVMPRGFTLPRAPPVEAAQLPRGTWVWNIGIGQGWDTPARAGGLDRDDPISRWRRVGALRTPPGASGGAAVTAGGVIGMVLQDAGDYSLLLPVERIVQLFIAWDLPVNLLTQAQAAVLIPPSAPSAPSAPTGPCGSTSVQVSLSRGAAPLSAAEECALTPKTVFKECAGCPEMVVVPAGRFTMGSPSSENGRAGYEGPRHAVTFARQLAVGRFALTFDEWDACVADGGCTGDKPSDQGWGRGRRPVIRVSWDDAKEYAAWLSRKTGKTYRLLSEAEREYVTRAGTTTPFWWGGSISTSQANYNSSYGNRWYDGGATGEYRQKTLPVDSFQPNPWGLFQVHGNVFEWVEDCWNGTYQGAPSDGSAWTSGNCSLRVVRGGAWVDVPEELRAAIRLGLTTDVRGYSVGFRVARALAP